MKTLFDVFGEEPNFGGSSNSFMDKLTSIQKDYETVLGLDTVEFVEKLVEEYNEIKEFHFQLNELIDIQHKKSTSYTSFSVLKSDFPYVKSNFIIDSLGLTNKYDNKLYSLNSKLTVILGQLRGIVQSYIEEIWNIDYDASKSFENIEITKEVILEEILKATNNGDFKTIRDEQLHKSILKNLIWNSVDLNKQKVVFERFFSTDKCKFFKTWSSHSDYKKVEILNKTLKHCFDFPENEQKHISFHLNKRDEKDGAFEEYKFLSSVIEKLKLLKNGKLEIHFKTDNQAKKYFNDYILPNLKNK
ncbi:hypothetical protein [Aliarcobacter butzleri]|uniref:hypothetical protein n=1 Tax=Aliarcobacter butzleri TaxID=28197 RepID=UPI0034507939